MSRKIKDIKDKHTGELVYPRTHVSAVVLSSDSTLEDLVEVKQDKINDLDTIRAGAAKGATALQSVPSEYVTETELSNKGYATISALNNKVDAINGKQLSTEDFTTALKNKLEGLSNYDDTELSNALSTLRGDFDKIVSGDTTTAIKTFNEVIAFLDGLTDTQDLESIIANIEQQIAGKQDKLVSGTNIKSINGESLVGSGNIAIPGKDVTGVIFTINGSDTTAGVNAEIFNDYTNNIASGKYSHAEGYQTIAKGSYSHAEGYGTFTDGAAAHAEGYNTQATARYAHAEGASCIASGNNSHAEGNESKSIGHYSHAEGNFTTSNGAYSHTEGNYAKTGTNGTYAHAEGSYTEANSTGSHAEGNYTIANAAFTHTEGNYTKASSPYQHVRGKYNAIDTEGKYNTIIGNGTSESDRRNIFTIDWDGNVICDGKITINDSCEIVNNGDLVTLKYLQTVLNNNENVDKTYVDNAIDLLNQSIGNKQNAITDLETIRQGAAKGATALQSYTEQYTGTVTSVKINGVTKNQSSGVVDLGYVNKQLSTTTSSSMTLSPNVYYRNTSTSLTSLTITLGGTTNNDIINEYFVEFTTRDAGTTVSLPNSIKWANGVAPTFENGKTYQISIVNNLGTCVKFG